MPDLSDAFGDADPQDGAEALDEDNLDLAEERNEMRTFEELPDLLDMTQADGDRDDDEAVALDADEFDEDAFGDADTEEDHELDLHAATEEREDDLDGQGPEDGFNEDRVSARSVEGLDQVADAGTVEGGEDDVTDFQAAEVSDADLQSMGYSEPARGGGVRAKPER
ncbi:MAG TPA: hypothetical protein VNW53_06955 [Phenylobacterium sp.]|jgi:hypothetical protein|uniref:hypothetical protein n=1 Tax=Phenylobacterium sp. TaxID=1871053 RepID=UPI002D0DD586|nr:hypothetical protein [Phenylobacterium sp.]HXA38719.1 hypothetical protein [Phenylobacterium sp.]